jgi:hypothetical protein
MTAGTRIRILGAVLALGLLTALPMAVHFLRQRFGQRPDSQCP